MATFSTTNNRFDYIDFAKSLTMLLIIWAHIRLGDRSNAFAYAFHIPMFFFLSGMVFDRKRYSNFKEFFKRKINSLFIPYVIISILTWCLWAIFSYVAHVKVNSYVMPLLQTFIAQGSAGFLVHNVPLWFVTCLFVIEMIYWLLSSLPKHKIIIISFLLAATSYCIIEYCPFIPAKLAPWSVDVALLGIPFYAVGNIVVREFGHERLQEIVSKNTVWSILILATCAIIVYVGSGYNGSISFGHADMGRNVFVTYSCAFLGIIMMLIGCILLANINYKSQVAKMLWGGVKWFGKNSFYAMSIHKPILGFALIIVDMIFNCGKYNVSADTAYSLVAFIITLFATIIGIYLINFCMSSIKIKSCNAK